MTTKTKPKARFADRLGVVRKVDNHDASRADKVDLRQKVLAGVGPEVARVFDAFAGTGQMHAEVWRRAEKGYVGCDIRHFPEERSDRLMFVGECTRVMRNIDLQQFNIFDFDAYGSPWTACIILAARRKVAPGEKLGLCITEGSGLNLKFGGMSNSLSQLASMRNKTAGMNRGGKEIASRAIVSLAKRMGCKVTATWRAERPQGSQMLYFGVVMEGIPVADAVEPT